MKTTTKPNEPTRKALAENAKISPSTTFDDPSKVVSAGALTKKEKVGILAQWEADAIALQTASDEGMSGGNRPRLDEVKSAQTMLGAEKATISAVATNVTCIETFKVDPKKADRLISELEAIAKQARQQSAGYVSTSIHKSEDGTHVVNYSQWVSKSDLETMQETPNTKSMIKKAAQIAEKSKRVIYAVVFAE